MAGTPELGDYAEAIGSGPRRVSQGGIERARYDLRQGTYADEGRTGAGLEAAEAFLMAAIKKRLNGSGGSAAAMRTDASTHGASDARSRLSGGSMRVTAPVVTGQYVDPPVGKITFATWWKEWSERQVWTGGTREAAQQAADCVTFVTVPLKALHPSHFQTWIKAMS